MKFLCCAPYEGYSLDESRWPNEFDRTMTTMNLNNWTWPKLKPTNILKQTNLNFTSVVLLISLPDVFSCRGAKRGWACVPPSASLRARAGGPVQADRKSIFFCCQGFICRCREFQKLRFVGVKIFRSCLTTNFSHNHLVKLTSLKVTSS